MSQPAITDVVILGGGLAGLCLAIQLKQRDPDIQVTVLERNTHPVREAAFKVGESTVEIAAHYFSEVLGLRDYLDREHIRKFGFRFFFSEGRQEVDRCTELGISEFLPAPSWQLDRGRFENYLGLHARSLGVDFRDGTVVRGIEMGGDDEPHAVRFEHAGSSDSLQARWLVDASGRTGLLKHKLGLAESNDHDVNAAWWRVDGHVDPADWSSNEAWLQRCKPPLRWQSTNHMCGPGYWFWLIPLSSDSHSLGIVCDARMHPLTTMNTHDKAMAWLAEHQPRMAQALGQDKHRVQDFKFLRHFSHGCTQVFSTNRWAITGVAGVFLDPFYSPGSDFIAISNSYVCDLIGKDRAGQPFAAHAEIYQQLYFSFYRSTLTLYQDQYPLFGDARVMPLKVIWDYTYYWSVLAPLFISARLTALPILGRLRGTLERASSLNAAMQPLLREWGERNAEQSSSIEGPLDGRDLDQYPIDWFRRINAAISDELDDDPFVARVGENVALMARLATQLLARARSEYPHSDDHGLTALLGGAIDKGRIDDDSAPMLEPFWYGTAPAINPQERSGATAPAAD
ncbi:NAD(P)/FAD-dependent oxidoreductase [Lysobacter sp. A286]